MQLGAVDYLNKPFEEEELEATLAKVLERRELEHERDDARPGAGGTAEAVTWPAKRCSAVRACSSRSPTPTSRC